MKWTAAIVTAFSILALVPAGASARDLTPGKVSIWAGLHGGKSQLVGATTGLSNVFEASELGLHLAGNYAISPKWTAVVSGGFDVGSNQFKPEIGGTQRLSINSWNVRIGFDRYAFIDDHVAIYAGPGLIYWRGNAEVDGTSSALDGEWPTVRQIGFNGRIGMKAYFNPHYALFGHIGQVIASNSAENGDGRSTWWSNHNEGTVGISVDL